MMDSFEFTKIAAAVLTAMLFAFGLKTAVEIGTSGHGGGHEAAGYTLPVKEGGGGHTAAAAAPAAFDAAKVVAAAASASADAGVGVFKKCASCHTTESGGANKTGPNLHGIVGRGVASVAGFGYSDAMKAKGGAWTPEALAAFLHDPKGVVKGTKMSFGGVADEGDLAGLLAYLTSLK
ncbi:MAG: cytochrome c family protein [Hyphomicrobiaceae bacterium]